MGLGQQQHLQERTMITIEYSSDYIQRQLETHSTRYSGWDQNFLLDIAYLIQKGRELSPRQQAHLGQLMHKAEFWNKIA
jgi:hypothetical protein